MQKQFYLILTSLTALVLVSGCTIPSGSVSGNGVTIDTFEAEFSEVYAGEPVRFRLLMKNLGSVEATDIKAEVLGVEDWGDGGEECNIDTLAAPDPSRGTSGGMHICEFEYTAPQIEQGYTLKYSPTVRVYYTYKSGVIKLITFGSHRELRTLADSGSPLPIDIVSKTSSPIELDITTKGPIRFWDSSVTFPLEIIITNVGGGIACAGSCETEENKNKVSIEIEGEISTSGCEEGEVPLWKGQTRTLVCEATASGMRDVGTTQMSITAQAEYEYYIDKTASITVIGRKQ